MPRRAQRKAQTPKHYDNVVIDSQQLFYTKNIPEKQIKFKTQFKPKNTSQELYIQSLRETTITIGVGPAGTGKTFITTRIALEKLINNEISKIVLTRPVVESGEKLGALPGDLEAKLHPYLLPLFDCIADHVGPIMAKKLMETGKIEIAPLAYMRGRTFSDSFVILDEAQNTSKEQIKMFMTRLGYNSFIAINGDPAQSDLQNRTENGLVWISNKLRGIDSQIEIIEFRRSDIVRHPLIETILTYLEN